jgi:crossover junction endodeoxyribonuclease RuvC
MKILGIEVFAADSPLCWRTPATVAHSCSTLSIFRLVGIGAKERVDVIALRTWVLSHRPDHCLIERAQAMPKQGASSDKYGRAVGAIEAVIAGCEVPLTIIEPTAWKKFHTLRGGDKESSRQRALQLFPAAHAMLARKMDHGRAESALLAVYGARVLGAAP